jgi:hypothetical protein
MGIDRTSDGADAGNEDPERTTSADRRPPPTDRPGTDSYPSRADSRNGAVAANDTGAQAAADRHEERPDVGRSSQDASASQGTASENLPDEQGELEPPERDPAAGETLDDQATPRDRTAATDVDEQETAPRKRQTDDVIASTVTEGQYPTADESQHDLPDDTGESPAGQKVTRDNHGVLGPVDQVALESDGQSEVSGPWKFALQVGEMPLEDYLVVTAGDYRRPDDFSKPKDQVPEEGPVWVEKLSDLPGGEELRDVDSDKLSRLDSYRKGAYRKLGDLVDSAKQNINDAQAVMGRPPTGSHAQVRMGQPEVSDAPHHGATAGELATGVIVFGMILGEGIRRTHHVLAEKGRS